MIRKNLLVLLFIFMFVLGGAFMFASKDAKAVADNNPTSLGARYIISWTPSSGATTYRLKVYEGTSSSPVFTKDLNATTYDLTDYLATGKVYYYTVEAGNSFGFSLPMNKTLVKAVSAVAKSTVATVPTTFSGYDVASVKAKLLKFDAVAKAKATAQVAVSAADTANKAYEVAAKEVITSAKALDLGFTSAKNATLKAKYDNYKIKTLKADTAVEKANTAIKALDRAMEALTGGLSSAGGTVTLNSTAQTVTINNGIPVFASITRDCCPNGISAKEDPIGSFLSEASRKALGIATGTGTIGGGTVFDTYGSEKECQEHVTSKREGCVQDSVTKQWTIVDR